MGTAQPCPPGGLLRCGQAWPVAQVVNTHTCPHDQPRTTATSCPGSSGGRRDEGRLSWPWRSVLRILLPGRLMGGGRCWVRGWSRDGAAGGREASASGAQLAPGPPMSGQAMVLPRSVRLGNVAWVCAWWASRQGWARGLHWVSGLLQEGPQLLRHPSFPVGPGEAEVGSG